MPVLSTPPKQKNSLIYLLIIALLITAFYMFSNSGQTNSKEVTLNTFVEKVQSGNISKVIVSDNKINMEMVDGSKNYAFKEPGSSIYEILEKAGLEKETISKIIFARARGI